MKIKSFAVSLLLLTGLLTSLNSYSQAAPGNGCYSWGSVNNLPINVSYVPGDYQFFAGETLILSFAAPVTGSPTDVHFYKDYVGAPALLGSTTFPGTIRYTFPADEVVSDMAFVVFPLGSQVTGTFSCEQPNRPIPTLNWQGSVVLVSLLAGFAYYRRRKVVV